MPPLSAFGINGGAPSAHDALPRSGGGGSEKLVLPEPTGLNGNGLPCGAVGYASYELEFADLSAAGFAWYVAFTGVATYAELTSIEVWNPWTATWVVYSHAHMHRPTYETVSHGGLFYRGVKILFTELY